MILAALLLAMAPAAGAAADDGEITRFLLDSFPVFDVQGVQAGRKAKTDLKAAGKTYEIVGTNTKGQLGVTLTDGTVVYVRRGDVAYTGTPPGPCIVVTATPRPGRESLAAGGTGATKGAGEGGQRPCIMQ